MSQAPAVLVKIEHDNVVSHATLVNPPAGMLASPVSEEKAADEPDTDASSTVPESPTTMHQVADGHETALRFVVAPVVTGRGTPCAAGTCQ